MKIIGICCEEMIFPFFKEISIPVHEKISGIPVAHKET